MDRSDKIKLSRNFQVLILVTNMKVAKMWVISSICLFVANRGRPDLEVIKLEFILKLKIKHNDWLLADTCLQAANHCALF